MMVDQKHRTMKKITYKDNKDNYSSQVTSEKMEQDNRNNVHQFICLLLPDCKEKHPMEDHISSADDTVYSLPS